MPGRCRSTTALARRRSRRARRSLLVAARADRGEADDAVHPALATKVAQPGGGTCDARAPALGVDEPPRSSSAAGKTCRYAARHAAHRGSRSIADGVGAGSEAGPACAKGRVPRREVRACHSSSAPARWAAGSRRWSPRRADACRCTIRSRARSSGAWRRCAKSSLAQKRGADVEGDAGARSRRPTSSSPADLMIEAITEDAAAKEDVFRRADAVLPRRTRSSPRTRARSRSRRSPPSPNAPGAGDRDALLQPGAGAEARRGDPRRSDL